MKKAFSRLYMLGLLTGCFIKEDNSESKEVVNIYSARHYDVDKTILGNFEKETGIKVNIITDDAEKLIARLEREGKNSPCDVLITADASNLFKASAKGLVQPLTMDDELSEVPFHLKNKNWVALTKRARIIVYHPSEIPADSLTTYEQLGHSFFKGKLLMRSSDNAYNRSLVASVLYYQGEEATSNWIKNMVSNFAQDPSGNDRDQVKAIAAGTGAVSVINTYYLAQMCSSDDGVEVAAANNVKWIFPNQQTRGAHINITGACISKHAPNAANARKLISYLLKEKNQLMYANINKEFPVINDLTLQDSLLNAWVTMKYDTLSLTTLGSLNEKAMQLILSSGWK
ncbi:MAG: extracellular solute-binding protein [Flavobacteriales bacterium]